MKKQTKPANSGNKRDKSSPKDTPSRQESLLFPIVGIGASAGGLEALEQFLRHVPENSGMAFVIVQHLDPTHKGIMPELLQRTTGMEVFQVRDRMKVKPNCVYVIPPNKDMSILHGVLHLFEPTAPRGLRLPIDFFLRSLAEDRQERSIGVILSGMGSDGTMGLRAIKEKAGVALVQEPASAKFDSMPRSAIDAGLADLVAPAEDLPGKIIDYLRHALVIAKTELPLEEKDQSALEKVLILLRAKTGHDFSLYKKNTVYRRIERRMSIHQIDRIAAYVRYLQENPQEVELLFKELLIGVTSFFRDPAAWEQLQGEAIPALLAGRPAGGVLRAWSAGCSTGEEAYSLAIAFKEALEQVKPTENFTLQIFATDLDRDAIDKARQGVYPANIAADVSPERLQPVFYQGRERLPGRQGDPGDGDLRHAERHHGPPLYQAGYPHLPQPSDLSDAGTAEKAPAALSLQPEPGRRPVSGERGDRQHLHRSLRAAEHQVETLPAARIGPAGRTGGVSSLVCPRPAGSSQGVNDVETCSQSPVARGPAAPAALFPACRAGQRQG